MDHRRDSVAIAERGRLQDKSDRYYLQEAMALDAGQVYV